MKIKMKKMLGIILSFALVLGLIPGMSLTAYAAPEETLLTTITPTGEITYSETTAGVVTVSHNNDYYNEYYGWLWSSTVDTLTVSGYEGYTITKVIFKQYQRGTVTDSSAPFELHFVNGSYGHVICQENDNMNGVTSIEVYGYTVAVTGVSLNKNTATLTVGGTETLTATVSPDDASDKSVTWSSDNTGVATVSDGVVTAVAEGTANITVTATNGTDDTSDDKTATCAVTVTENNGDTKQNPDGTKTVTKENADGKTISVTNYSKTDEQISQFVFEKAKGTTLDLTNVNSKTLKTVVIPESVKANGNTYKVTRIRKGFLKNCKQATKVDIGKNINTIDKKAFNYGKKVQKVVIRGKLKKVGKNAFKNTKKNVVIKVKTSVKNFEKNKKLLEKSGLPTNATIKRVKNKK